MTLTLCVPEQSIATQLEDYVAILRGASGITEGQARICVLYALCTYREDSHRIPLLAIMGRTGTGKSTLLDQMEHIVKAPFRATARTKATQREEMKDCPTYIIDEADRVSEGLLQARTDLDNSFITHNVGTGRGWKPVTSCLFGATILARRKPFGDSAVRNRAIVIHTENNPGDYTVGSILRLDGIAHRITIEELALGSGRVQDTWTPLLEVAKAIDNPIWEEAVINAIGTEERIFRSGQNYEAEDVILQALDKLTWDIAKEERQDIDVGLSNVAKEASDAGDVILTNKQVEELLITNGFSVSYTHGIRLVRSNMELLERLLQGC
ncbi:hypothetical protein ACFLUO_04315 [Chloroflexota bacterium]